MLEDVILSELLNSGISPEVIELNTHIVDDIEFDPITKEAIATPIDDELGFRYVRFGQSASQSKKAVLFVDEEGKTWQAKIFTQERNGDRTGQYLAPLGIGDKLYRPNIPNAIALQAVGNISFLLEASLRRWFEDGGLFWDWFLLHPEVPLLITEGAKKALAAISQGYIAVSLFGCTCGVKDLAVKPELRPYVESRPVTIAFDSEKERKKQHKVFTSTKRLASAIAYDAKGKPAIAAWDSSKGKGIDDLIANDPAYFHAAIKTALSFDKWKLSSYKDLSKYNLITINQRFLDIPLPDYVRLVAVKSPKGTGKTEWIAQQVALALKMGIPVIVISHREQLAKELSNRFGVSYRTELNDVEQGKQFGYALCIDSLHPKANPPFYADSWAGCWVIIDECEQVFWHLLNSDTCQYNRVNILGTLSHLFNVAERIFLADADLSRISLDYAVRLLDEPVIPWLVVNEWQPEIPKRAYVYSSPEMLLSDALEAVRNGDRIICHTGAQKVKSKYGTINLESVFKKAFPELKILRIDAESVADPSHLAYGCMGNLNAVLALYDIVIASPTIETGVSIDIKHFDRVFCWGTGTQTTEAVGQTLERVRENVPRHIWIAENSQQRIGNGSDNPGSLIKSQQKLFKVNWSSLSQADAIAMFDDEDKDPHHLKTWATLAALKNYGFKNYRASILDSLKNEGYSLIEVAETDEQINAREELKSIRDANYQEHCEKVSQALILDDLEYQKVKDKRAKTETERLSEQKTAIAKRYATEEITPDLVKADEDGWHGQIQLHYYLTIGNAFLQKRDAKKVKKLTNEGQSKALIPDINNACLSPKIRAMKAINIEQFFERDREFTSDGLQEWFDGLMPYRRDIKTYINQTISPDKDTPIGAAQRLLRTMGLQLDCIGKRTINGKRQRVYVMANLNPDSREAVFARWLERDTSEQVSTPPINSNYLGVCA